MKKVVISLLSVISALVLLVGGYLVYVLAEYSRIPDGEILSVRGAESASAPVYGREYTLLSWNVGFAAYSKSFGFFMDGGKESRAYSKAEVMKNLEEMNAVVRAEDPDFLFLQEVDEKAHRSHRVNERAYFEEAFPAYSASYAVNFHSAYLFYPVFRPHGKSRSGILTLSALPVTSAVRRSLPVDGGISKFFDLDRCYVVSRVAAGEKELVLFNLHLSAYSKDGSVNRRQLAVLYAEMAAERAKGNYVIAAGDFNQDLLGNSGEVFGIPTPEGVTWCAPFDTSALPEGFRLLAPTGEEGALPSCRNCDGGYEPGVTFTLTVDGFLVSDNVEVSSATVLDCGFENSDHNPVRLNFLLYGGV